MTIGNFSRQFVNRLLAHELHNTFKVRAQSPGLLSGSIKKLQKSSKKVAERLFVAPDATSIFPCAAHCAAQWADFFANGATSASHKYRMAASSADVVLLRQAVLEDISKAKDAMSETSSAKRQKTGYYVVPN